jgi:putative ABC transport system permease protein
MTTLTLRLAFAGTRTRKLQAVLVVIVVSVATAALSLAMTLDSVATRPFDRTFEQTNGAHVTVFVGPGGPSLTPLETIPGVVETTGSRPVVFTAFDLDGKRYGLRVVGLPDEGQPRVSRPLLEEGDWPGPGEIALERSLADFHGLGAGDTVVTPSGPVRVSGTVIIVGGAAYPQSQPGLAVARESTLAGLQPDRARWAHTMGLRIEDPDAAPSMARTVIDALGGETRIGFDDWIEDRAESANVTHVISIILSIFSVLLLLASGAVLATLLGGQIVARSRDIGTLKATGLTPRQVSRVLLAEQLALGIVGVAAGLVLARLLAPLFTAPTASLLSASETPATEPVRVAIVVAVVLGLVTVFTLVPGLHAARRSTAEMLVTGRSGGARRSRLGALVDRLGLPLVIGVGARGCFARRGRTLLTAFALALTVASIVATLGMEASLDVATDPGTARTMPGTETPLFDPVDDDAGEGDALRPVVYSLDALLLFVGLVNLIATLLLTTRERVRDLGLLKAVGLTPRQVTGSLVSEQAVVASIAALAGLPIGLGLFRLGVGLSGGSEEFAYPSWWSLVVLVPVIVIVVGALTAPLARRAAALRVTDALRFE